MSNRNTTAETLAMKNKIYMTVQESVIGAGTGNYNRLENIPIVNLLGSTEEKCVDLSGLKQGSFTLKGYHRLTPTSEVEYLGERVDVTVLNQPAKDGEPEKRVLVYLHPITDELYIRKIVYTEGFVISDKDICLTEGNLYWEEGDGGSGNQGGNDQGGSSGDTTGDNTNDSGDDTGGSSGDSGGSGSGGSGDSGNDDNTNNDDTGDSTGDNP